MFSVMHLISVREVAKEAADIVLLDDNLESVVAGIEQGRLCSENLRKSILYTLCSKLPQVSSTECQKLVSKVETSGLLSPSHGVTVDSQSM